MSIVPGLVSDEPEMTIDEAKSNGKKVKKTKEPKADKSDKSTCYASPDLVKEYGESVFMTVDFLIDEEREVLSLSPACDIALNGGIPMGGIVVFSGKTGTGKTSSALQLIANAQQVNPNRKIYWDDVEHRLSRKNLSGIHGLIVDPKNFKVIQSTQEKILTAEDHVNIMLRLIKDTPNCIAVIDSASALCGEGEMGEKVKGSGRASGPKLMAALCRQLAPIVRVNKCLVIIVQHMIANTGTTGGPTWVEDGGEKIKYHADVRMRIKYIEKWKAGENVIGQVIHWEVVKSALGPPVDMFDSYLRYGYGLDDVWEIIDLACDIGLIKKGGSWFELIFDKKEGDEEGEKVQGQENLYQLLRSRPELYQQLHTKVKESLK